MSTVPVRTHRLLEISDIGSRCSYEVSGIASSLYCLENQTNQCNRDKARLKRKLNKKSRRFHSRVGNEAIRMRPPYREY
jgi:hypothetical protein